MSESAFPWKDYDGQGDVCDVYAGMTLRDYFAAKAFQARLEKYNDWTLDELSSQAYKDADAMLKARQE
jgi:hypothetical protein